MAPEEPPPPNTSPQLDALEIRQLVREELDRKDRYLEFAQGQIAQDRTFYKHLYTYTGSFIALMVGVGGFFTYSNVSQMRSDMKTSVDAELVALRAQANAANLE